MKGSFWQRKGSKQAPFYGLLQRKLGGDGSPEQVQQQAKGYAYANGYPMFNGKGSKRFRVLRIKIGFDA